MKENLIKGTLIGFGSFFLIVFTLGPCVFMLLTSFSKNPDFLASTSQFEFTLMNYRDVLSNSSVHFLAHLKNSLVVSTASALLAVWIASMAAYAITRISIPGRQTLLLAVLAASMFPPVSLVSYLFKLMAGLGWINTLTALIIPYTAWTLPLTLWILVSYFSQIPKELDDAAIVDGCSRWQTLRKVVYPVAMPSIVAVGLLAFIFAFNEFLFALMLTTDFEARTVPVGIALFQGLYGQIPWGSIMAASTITTLPVVLLAVFFQGKIVTGLSQGSVKG